MKLHKIILLLSLCVLLTNCKQKVTVKKHKVTSINPIAYTDVIFKAGRDTVFVSTFDGKIYQLVNENNNKKQIAAIGDEIYDLAYHAEKNELYAATLNSGIVIINVLNGAVIDKLPIRETWAYQICFNTQNGILATFDFKGNHYVWDTNNDFRKLDTPDDLKGMSPKYIADNGDIYFDGLGKLISWNYRTNNIKQSQISGKIADVDDNRNVLIMGGKEFAFYDTREDSIIYTRSHPNWPIYVPQQDSIVNIPLSLEVLFGLTSNKSIYTLGLDKSIREWNKWSGRLIKTYSKHRGTPSGMDITADESQLVTVDLLGKICFWNL
ncbi:WD40 repeat domain-containing protein [Albibacterium indicum]|uniref:hypothetical protein n=1 Tax=Albibacterium indicum TaxID=2292082 RepID=UPI000E4A1193|nr:hypothetical protein [Pedobacter indicus]